MAFRRCSLEAFERYFVKGASSYWVLRSSYTEFSEYNVIFAILKGSLKFILHSVGMKIDVLAI